MRTGGSTVWHWTTSWRAHLVFGFARVVVKPVMAAWPTTDRGLAVLARLEGRLDRMAAPPNTTVEPMALGGVRCERVTHQHRAADAWAGATILYFHGGGFLFCGLGSHRGLCAQLAAYSGAPVVSVDYRQLPHGGIGTSIADAMTAYRELLDSCDDPTRVVVAGDSAGGYLAMKVAEIAALQGLPTPAAVLGYSPLLNLDLEAHDPEFMRRDAYLPMNQVRKVKDRWLSGPEKIIGAQSPVDADPALFPPLFLVAAEYELMRPDVEYLTARFEQAGQPVETHLWAGQIHAFPVLGPILSESREIVGLSVEFARRSLGAVRKRSA